MERRSLYFSGEGGGSLYFSGLHRLPHTYYRGSTVLTLTHTHMHTLTHTHTYIHTHTHTPSAGVEEARLRDAQERKRSLHQELRQQMEAARAVSPPPAITCSPQLCNSSPSSTAVFVSRDNLRVDTLPSSLSCEWSARRRNSKRTGRGWTRSLAGRRPSPHGRGSWRRRPGGWGESCEGHVTAPAFPHPFSTASVF